MGSAYFRFNFQTARAVIASEANHRTAGKTGLLVAALLAMTPRGHTPAISPRDAREFCSNFRPSEIRAQGYPKRGAGNAGCSAHPQMG
jgi:hypothetical protein